MNPFLSSLRPIWCYPRYVFLHQAALKSLAAKIAAEDIPVPAWREPIFPQRDDNTFIDFIGVANAINFAFTDFYTRRSFSVMSSGKEWRGANAMFACLGRAIDKGIPILQGEFLSQLSERQCEEIFAGDTTIPMFKDRWFILREVGHVLTERFAGSFSNLFERSRYTAFGEGGVVNILLEAFPSFRDESVHKPTGKVLRFHKRAQLLAMMYQGRALASRELPPLSDFRDLGPIAEYTIPRGLNALGILRYVPELDRKIRNWVLIDRNSEEELEIRAQAVNAQAQLLDQINLLRASKICALSLDYKLWTLGHVATVPHHLTETVAY